MPKEQCRGRHLFVPDEARINELSPTGYVGHLWKCKRCGFEMDVHTPREEYDRSYFGNVSSAWDPETMHRSKINSFEISYTIDVDRYQIFKYSSRKLVYLKTWGLCRPDNPIVDKAADYQKPHELSLTEEEDREIHNLLENTDFESWENHVDNLPEYAMGIIRCGGNRLPNFECTFKDQPYVYYKEFPKTLYWRLRNQNPYEEYHLVELLVNISKNHGINLYSFWDYNSPFGSG